MHYVTFPGTFEVVLSLSYLDMAEKMSYEPYDMRKPNRAR